MPKPKAVTSTSSSPFQFKGEDVPLNKLLLDPNNYRFLDRRGFKRRATNRAHEEAVQRATLELLESSYQLEELKHSILTIGYVPMERVIVAPYSPRAGYFLVIEGNRRVASLKSLLKDDKDGAIKLSAAQRSAFSKIPCAILKSEGLSQKHAERVIMGIRHIAGPKEWGAYQQALLVSELRDEEELEFKEIGEMLGISSPEAARRYRAITALKHMENDELFSRKAEPSFYHLFHELVALPDVRVRFGWSPDNNTFEDVERARQFFELITSDGQHDVKLKSKDDIRKLKFIVGRPKAEDSLFDPEQAFSEAVRLGEHGKPPGASTLLADARESITGIGYAEAQTLTPADLKTINDLLVLLGKLKQTAEETAGDE